MTLDDLLLHLSRVFFIGIVAITLVDYVRRRDNIRRDIFLAFFGLSFSTVITVVRGIIPLELSPQTLSAITLIGQMAVIAQPFLMIRLVRYFQPVPIRIFQAAAVGMVISWVAIIFITFAQTPVAQSVPVTLVIIVNFVVFDGYAVFAFVYGAFSSVGVTRQRLRCAAAGSGFLVVILLLAGVNAVAPQTRTYTLPLIRLFSILCSIAFYFGFAPPHWLRQSWRDGELRRYLLRGQVMAERTQEGILKRFYEAITRGLGANVVRVKVALWDPGTQHLTLQVVGVLPSLASNPHLDSIVQKAWQERSPVVIDKSRGLTSEDIRLLDVVNAESILIVPIASYEQALGQLVVFLQHGSLFIDEELGLLEIFAQQMAFQLQYFAMLDEVTRRNVDLEHSVKERTLDLQRTNEELQMFAYVASHDLQEPLRTISSYLQLIDSRYTDKLDSDGREYIAFAVDGAARMKELIEDVLVYLHVETERKAFAAFDLQSVLDETIKSLEATINEAQATITSDPLPQAKGDRRLVAQIFQNLLSNAIKYRGERKPEIHIGVIETPEHWQFSVRDNGIGIEPQYLEQIFVVFRRLHHRENYQGTGIGLAVCKKAVELHGGQIWAESVVREGTTFLFTIPK